MRGPARNALFLMSATSSEAVPPNMKLPPDVSPRHKPSQIAERGQVETFSVIFWAAAKPRPWEATLLPS